jgi:uncharacterized membrane protein
MIDDLVFTLTFITALGSGLVAGVFYAFSTFVMKGLARLPSAQGIAAMQSINITVINPLFLGAAFFGTAVASVLVIVSSLLRWSEPEAVYLLSGGLVYLIGTILVTMAFNVPRNNVLAAADPQSADGARLWAGYVTSWTAWNHVRTVAALAAAVLLTIALLD